MQAYGEGFEILEKSQFNFDLEQIAELWCHGSVVRSWLLELLVLAFKDDPGLANIRGLRRGHRRRTLDRAGRDRRKRAGAGHHALAHGALRLASRRIVQREGDRRAAQSIRRPRSKRRRRMPDAVATVSADGKSENPLRTGLHSERISDPCSIVFFGASGDLFKRMLLPAMYSLRLHGVLPNDFGIIGVSRSEYIERRISRVLQRAARSVCTGRSKAARCDVGRFRQAPELRLRANSTITNATGSSRSSSKITTKISERGAIASSTSPRRRRSFRRSSTCSTRPASVSSKTGWTRIIIEKPFGTDLDLGARAASRGRPRSSTKARSTASITTSAKSRCRTSWRCALRT